jgi:biopolymer transport protein ExbB
MADESFVTQTLDIWLGGGLLMIPLALLACLIYFSVLTIYYELASRQFQRIDDNLWRHWVDKPDDGQGELGDIIRFLDVNAASPAQLRIASQVVQQDYLPRLNARIRFATILVSAAPLMGLLGTVMGMLTTFDGISISAGASTAGLVAGGIAEALITTETGLVIAIPGYILISKVKSMRESLALFIVRLENAFVRRTLRRQQLASHAA